MNKEEIKNIIKNIIVEGYKTILKREVDNEGLIQYINSIENGLTVEKFYESLKLSKEYIDKSNELKIDLTLEEYINKYNKETQKSISKRITVICPTYNNLEYLELFYKSYVISKLLSRKSNEIKLIVAINGNDVKTEQYCIVNKIDYVIQEKLGMYSAINNAAKNIIDGFLVIVSDDVYLDESFFINLNSWLTNNRCVLFSNSIQPEFAGGTFTPYYNHGTTYKNFNKNNFIKYCREIEQPKSSFHNFGVVYVINYSDWNIINGFDENFDPYGGGMGDLIYRLFLSGIRTFQVLYNVLHYHFIAKCADKHNKFINTKNAIINSNTNKQTFINKWKKETSEIDKIMRKECYYYLYHNNETIKKDNTNNNIINNIINNSNNDNTIKKWNMYIDLLQEHSKLYKSDHTTNKMFFITQFIPPNKYPKMLDVGAGEGLETYVLQQLGYDVTGTIHGESNIEYTKTNFPSTKFIDIDFSDLPFKCETFDCVYMNQTFEHSYAPFIFLLELYSILKEKGRMWIALPHFKEINDPTLGECNKLSHNHPNILCDNLFQELFTSAGFKIIYHKPIKENPYFDNPFLLEKQSISTLHDNVRLALEKRRELFG